MKKYKFILCFIISIYIFSITAFAQTEDISANVKIDQFSVTISGNAKMSKYASLVVGTEEEIIYLDQADCDDNGNYAFTFNFDKEMPAGEYPFKISSDAVDGTYEGVINYLGNVTYKEEACAISDIKLEIVDFIPKIQGTISCIEGATIKYTFTDVTKNVVIDEKIITAEDGDCFISYELENLINTKKYNVTLTCNNDFHDLVLINANVNYSLNILTISYDMTFFNDSSISKKSSEKILGTF